MKTFHLKGKEKESIRIDYMNSRFTRNLSWIFFGNIVHAVLQFLLNIVCARSFGTSDYGLINYGASLIAFFNSIGTLGFYAVVTKYFAEDEKKAGEILGTGTIARTVFSVISIILLQIIVSLSDSSDMQIRLVVFCQSLSILFASSDLFVYWFRYKSEAKIVAILRLAAFFITAIWKLLSILVFHNIVIYVVGVSLEIGFFAFFQRLCFRKEYKQYKLCFSFVTLKKLLKISYPFIFSSLLATIYAQTDKIMLRSMLSNSAVGIYSVSLTLAGAIAIIPSALIEGFRPEIMVYKVNDESKYKQRFQQLYGLVFWVCITYCVFISIFAKYIILFLYGAEYTPAIPSLSLVVWYTSFSYFGSINNLFMVAEDKTKWVQVTTLIGAMLNIIMNYSFIPSMGVIGAALASLLTQVLANFLMPLIVPSLRPAFRLMVQGIAFRGYKGMNIRQIVNLLKH